MGRWCESSAPSRLIPLDKWRESLTSSPRHIRSCTSVVEESWIQRGTQVSLAMIFITPILCCLAFRVAIASELPQGKRQEPNTKRPTPPPPLPVNPFCINGPSTRQCWGGGYSITTDSETQWPVTGRTVSVCQKEMIAWKVIHNFNSTPWRSRIQRWHPMERHEWWWLLTASSLGLQLAQVSFSPIWYTALPEWLTFL